MKRPLNSALQHVRCLTDTLSAESAIWTLCSLMLPKAPEAELVKDDNPLVEALFNYQLIHVNAYVVHVDMVLQNEVAFKLTPETIEALIKYHRDIYTVDMAASTWSWSEKDAQVKKLRAEFVQAANRFVYRTNVHALEAMEDSGAGELSGGQSEDVKDAIMGLFMPLLPPPPRIVEIVRPVPLLPSSPKAEVWWSQPTLPSSNPAPVEPWNIVPSSSESQSPSSNSCVAATTPATAMALAATSADVGIDAAMPTALSFSPETFDDAALWTNMGLSEAELSSPTPSHSTSYSSSYSPPLDDSSPCYEPPQPVVPMTPISFPNLLMAQQCGASAEFGGWTDVGGFSGFGGFGGFGWDAYQDYTTTI